MTCFSHIPVTPLQSFLPLDTDFLHRECRNGNVGLVRIFSSFYGQPTIFKAKHFGRTCLHWATLSGKKDLGQYLSIRGNSLTD